MLRHPEIWNAIDRLAADRKLSASGLARRAGLDPTTFNKSKRIARDGRPRWPSTESIAKVLGATSMSFAEFVKYLGDGQAPSPAVRRIPVIAYAKASEPGYFDEAGNPTGSSWDELVFPEITDPAAYALEISGDALQPVFRDGDTVVVSPAASVRRGDRVVLRTVEGEMLVQQLARRGGRRIDVVSLNDAQAETALTAEQVSFIHRIIWLSQ